MFCVYIVDDLHAKLKPGIRKNSRMLKLIYWCPPYIPKIEQKSNSTFQSSLPKISVIMLPKIPFEEIDVLAPTYVLLNVKPPILHLKCEILSNLEHEDIILVLTPAC